MAHAFEKKQSLRAAYVHKSLSLEQAAAMAKVASGTASRWKKEAKALGDDWEVARAASNLSGEGMEAVARQLLTGYVVQHKAIMESIALDLDMDAMKKANLLGSLSDSFSKVVASSKRILPETDKLATALDVLSKLSRFTGEKFPRHTAALLEILEPFGAELARDL